MRKLSVTGATQGAPELVNEPVFWIRVSSTPSADAAWRFDGGAWQSIDGYEALQAPDGNGWQRVEIAGTVKVQIGENPRQKFPGALNMPNAALPSSGTSTNGSDAVVSVGAAAAPVLAANANRRTLYVQNLSTQVVVLSKDPGVVAAVAAANKILAVLAACAVAGDGTGGSFSLDGWTGPIYGIVAAGTSLVSAGDY